MEWEVVLLLSPEPYRGREGSAGSSGVEGMLLIYDTWRSRFLRSYGYTFFGSGS